MASRPSSESFSHTGLDIKGGKVTVERLMAATFTGR
jgi:hypothetical protein